MDQKKTREPVFKCPACGNTKKFYETGLANVKMKLTFNEAYIAESELVDLENFSGNSEITCAVCGAKAE